MKYFLSSTFLNKYRERQYSVWGPHFRHFLSLKKKKVCGSVKDIKYKQYAYYYYYYWRRNIYRVEVEEERDAERRGALRIIATNDESLYYP